MIEEENKYKKLLACYMNHLIELNGSSMLDYYTDNLKLEDVEELMQIEKDSNQIINGETIEKSRLESINEAVQNLITKHQLRGSQKLEIKTKRQAIMWWLRFNTQYTLSTIGQKAYKDHSTVLHAIRRVNEYIDTNDELMIEYCKEIWKELDQFKKEIK